MVSLYVLSVPSMLYALISKDQVYQLFMVCTSEWNAHQLLAPPSTKGLIVIKAQQKEAKLQKAGG